MGLWPLLKPPLAPPAHRPCEPAPEGRKVLCLVHDQRTVRKEDRKVNFDISLGTMGSVAEPELGLCDSSFPASL